MNFVNRNQKELKISVVIPTYNSRKTITRCLDSINLQTCQEFETIVVDDGSIDDTVEIVKNYIENNKSVSKILLYELKTNSGPSFARNYGIDKAKYDWVLFLDSDDEWCCYRVEKFIEFIEQNCEARIVFSRYVYIDGTEIPGTFIIKILEQFDYTVPRWFLFIKSFIATPTLAFNRRYIDERFDVKLKHCEDLDFVLRISKINRIYYLNNIMAREISRTGERTGLSCDSTEMKKSNIKVLENNIVNIFENIIFYLKRLYFYIK